MATTIGDDHSSSGIGSLELHKRALVNAIQRVSEDNWLIVGTVITDLAFINRKRFPVDLTQKEAELNEINNFFGISNLSWFFFVAVKDTYISV